MNRAKVGANSIIGVGAVVTEGVEIPPGSMVMGLPGKIKRELAEIEIEGNRMAAAHYVHNAKEYAAARSK
jgi:carbonic anhydrase/acetyltransferase-like protein (isoleucine patch superfamily)